MHLFTLPFKNKIFTWLKLHQLSQLEWNMVRIHLQYIKRLVSDLPLEKNVGLCEQKAENQSKF